MLRVRAAISLVSTAQGGRAGPIASGYRPSLRFGDRYADAAIELLHQSTLFPGEECEAQLVLVHPEHVSEFLKVDQMFDLTEGRRKVGTGTILGFPEAKP
jgi:translation elongation factor EF-Tu-like GTPase